MLFVDAMNVIGSRPDGWWKDREGAMRRLIRELSEWADEPVTVVLDAGPDDLIGTVGPVTVVRAQRRGRDAADDEIVRLVADGDHVDHVRFHTRGTRPRARGVGRGRGVI